MKFLTHRVSLQSGHHNFQKNFVLPKMAAILNFRIFRRNCKHKNAYNSKTVLDRAISTKFLTHRVSLQIGPSNFQKNFVSPKMAAILNFRIFHKNAYISKTVLDRAISTQKILTHRVSLQSGHCNSQKKFVSPKMAAILNFQIFRKNCKIQKCLYLKNRAR